MRENGSRKIRVTLVGVGNCASSLVQDVHFCRNARAGATVPGLMHVGLGGYHIRDIEFTAALDANRTEAGKDQAEAIFAEPNNIFRFAEVPSLGVGVYRGRTHDGLGKYLSRPGPAAGPAEFAGSPGRP